MVYGMDTGQLESPADRYGQGSRFYKNTKRVLKILAYFFYFLLVLCSAVASKGSFLLMTQSLGNVKQERQYASRWSMLIVAAMCIPYIFIFMESIAHSLFRNRKGPSLFDIMVVFCLEGIHTFGLCLLVFRVLPSCDVIRAVLLMNCLCIVPGFCKMVFSKNTAGPVGKAMIVMIDFVALLAQVTVFFIVMGTQYTAFIEKALYVTSAPPSGEQKPPDMMNDPFASSEAMRQVGGGEPSVSNDFGMAEKPKWKGSWETPFALLFTSIAWWENYVDRDIKLGFINLPLATYKRHLQSIRSKANIGASLWKIALTITFSVIMLPSKRFENAFVKMPSGPDVMMTTMVPPNIGGGGGGVGVGDEFGGFGDAANNNNAAGNDPFNAAAAAHKLNKRDAATTLATSTVEMISAAMEGILTVPNNAWNTPTTPNLFDFTAVREKTADDYWKSISPFIPFIVHFFSTGLCYYFAKSSCKMCMQRVAFALPLTLTTPIIIGIYMAICNGGLDRIDFIKDMMYWECSEMFSKGNLKWQLVFGLGLWWLSEIWIAIHAWFPENKRLASTELLFVLPQYDSALIEQSLLLNRRRNEREHLKRKLEEHFEELDIVDGMASLDHDKPLDITPKIYLCGTLWHETRGEMIQILKSIMRMDIDQSARKKAKDYFNVQDPDFYEIESHIFFDDAFEKNDKGEKTINMFVRELIGAIDKAASIVHDIDGMKMTPPTKCSTPYGGRLTWKLPGGNLLVVHLKDKKRVMKRKRWSMVMYMYYLLGYRLLGQCEDRLQALYKMVEEDPRRRKHKRHVAQNEEVHIYYKDVLGPKLLLEAENTYILSMDGDVDFGPDSVRMLVDRMKKNKKVGAACGRIHPIGTGPMIWFQKMEYALSYWLQKTTEHSLGCVLCAPGCFSMYRASALMDDNVMRMFAQKPEEPDDHILHDLGEDRWLSRLLIEQGYKIEYCAASDAYTHAPETITEYFNQRRRWIPSTLGNTVCFLKNYRRTIRLNENVSFLCILYHICFLASYILSPATITIAIADAFNATTDIDMWGSFILACLPAVVFLVVCYQDWKEEIKIGFAAMLGTYYSILMMIVVVGTIVRIVDGSWKTTAVLFLVIMAVIFFLTSLCHPFEISCVKPCFLFFLCIPTSYILIVIYSLTNMNQSTWGTRDNVYVPQKRRKANLDENDIKELEKQLTDAKSNNELINKIEELLENGASTSNDEILLQILAALERIEMKETLDKQLEKGVDVEKLLDGHQYNNNQLANALQYGLSALNAQKNEIEENSNLNWLSEDTLKFSDLVYLEDDEIVFWKKLIKKYLSVEKLEAPAKHKLQLGLNDMRDRGVFAFFMLNALWIAFVFPVLLAQDRLKDMLYIPIPIPSLYYQPVLIEPLGVLHLGFFAFISLLQFVAMLCHRYNTFQHILASTKLRSNIHEGMRIEDIIDTVKMLQQIKPIDEEAEPMPDYSDEEIDKISDDVSESDEVLIDGKPVNKNKLKSTSDTENNANGDNYLRQRNGAKHGHDNPAFIDDTNLNKNARRHGENGRSRSEDRVLDGGGEQHMNDLYSSHQDEKFRIQAKQRNRRSRRLQKKNSLDVQFRRRFSMLRDGNAAANNIYNTSGLFNAVDLDTTNANNNANNANNNSNNGISSGPGRDSRTSSMMPGIGPRASSGNLSTKILDKRFNKMLFNMHGIPVRPNVTNQQQMQQQLQQQLQQQQPPPEQHQMQETHNEHGGHHHHHHRHKGRRKHKSSNLQEHNL